MVKTTKEQTLPRAKSLENNGDELLILPNSYRVVNSIGQLKDEKGNTYKVHLRMIRRRNLKGGIDVECHVKPFKMK